MRKPTAVSIGLAAAALAWAVYLWTGADGRHPIPAPEQPLEAPDRRAAGADSAPPIVVEPRRMPLPVETDGVQIRVACGGAPVPGVGAFAATGSEPALAKDTALAWSDASERIELSGAIPGELVLSKQGFPPYRLQGIRPGIAYSVELSAGYSVRIRCVDATTGAPVAGARIALAAHGVPDPDRQDVVPGAHPETAWHTASSGPTGVAEFTGLAPHEYLVCAHHDEAVVLGGTKRIVAATSPVVDLRFLRPFVLWIELVGDELLTDDTAVRGCELAGPDQPAAQAFQKRVRSRVASSPNTIFWVGLPTGSEVPTADVTLWTRSGKYLEVRKTLRAWHSDLAPERIALGSDCRVLPTGELHVRAEDADGTALRFDGLYLRPRRAYKPAVPVRIGEARTLRLPEGEYVWDSSHQGSQQFLRGCPAVVVRANATTDYVLRLQRVPVLVSWELRLSDRNPFHHGTVEIRDRQGKLLANKETKSRGSAWLPAPATYDLRFRTPGYSRSSIVDVGPSPERVVSILERQPLGGAR
jgi:hypothetical protein